MLTSLQHSTYDFSTFSPRLFKAAPFSQLGCFCADITPFRNCKFQSQPVWLVLTLPFNFFPLTSYRNRHRLHGYMYLRRTETRRILKAHKLYPNDCCVDLARIKNGTCPTSTAEMVNYHSSTIELWIHENSIFLVP